MDKRKAKNYVCCVLAVLMTVSGTGCAKSELTELTEEEKDLYIEYSANIILKHDKNNIDRMPYVEPVTEAPAETVTQAGETSIPGISDEGSTVTGMNELFALQGLDIQPAGYEVLDSYPSGGSEIGMSMVAVKGYKLLVVKFHVGNTAGADMPLNMLETKAEYKGIINDSVRMNAQVTALLNAFNTYNGTIPAGGSEELVLVFQINENDADDISSVKLNVTYNDRQGTVVIN